LVREAFFQILRELMQSCVAHVTNEVCFLTCSRADV
jgi:hypothetical protein